MHWITRVIAVVTLSCWGIQQVFAENWQVGFAKEDITPVEPLRLSGYGSRNDPHTGVADQIHVRVVTLGANPATEQENAPKPLVIVSVESIGITSQMTDHVAKVVQSRYGVPRSQLVLSSTHSHTTPFFPDGLINIFSESPSEEQADAAKRNYARVLEAIEKGIDHAFQNRVKNAKVEMGEGKATFAAQRRVLRDGQWAAFGVQEGGQVDHRLFVLRITSEDGKLLGATYQYASHCTTLTPDFNQVSGDWAGLSASRLEQLHPNSVFVPIIGCGADANPNPRGNYEAAVQNSLEMTDSVQKVLVSDQLKPLPPLKNAQYGMVGLEPEHPTIEFLESKTKNSNPTHRRWGEYMLEVNKRMGRLPESIPFPVHVWQFGEALSWVFLGGEVVVNYQFAIEKELPTQNTWVASYCDDVPGYVASESQRAEGGYEVDGSMIYYMLPGRWKSGTQSTIITRVREIYEQKRGEDEPLDPQAALESMHVPDGYRVELIANEPLVSDPVNVAFGWDGRVWVAQMRDYPTGVENGGSIQVLSDTDGDGKLDRSTTFLEGISYPTSVHPWRNGVIILTAPNILFAEDTNGDGVSDRQRVLLTGIGVTNPQHGASGFEIGLDGRLHFGAGDGTRELVNPETGKTFQVQGNDVAWDPDTGEVEVVVHGKTQFIPARDSFGTWFGNHNSLPMFQFVMEASQLGGKTASGGVVHHLLSPAQAPPVFPRSRTVDRFNDQYARDRYTSACASIVVRVDGLRPSSEPLDTAHPDALVCEPVHNLVARIQLRPNGSVYSAVRHPQDVEFDFFASTDPWSRPVRAVNAPDGSIWIVDMYRRVIEHPQWIPVAWQERMDVRAGSGMGRIYRVFHQDHDSFKLPNLSLEDPLKLLQSSNGMIRDMTVQALVTDQIPLKLTQELEGKLRGLLNSSQRPDVVASVLGLMSRKNWLQQADVATVIQSTDNPQLLSWVLKLTAKWKTLEGGLSEQVLALPKRALGGNVDLQWVLASQHWSNVAIQPGLEQILERSQTDPWISNAITSVASPSLAGPIVKLIVDTADRDNGNLQQLQDQLSNVRKWVALLTPESAQPLFDQRFSLDAQGEIASKWNAGDLLLLAGSSGGFKEEKLQAHYRKSRDQGFALLLDSDQPHDLRQRLSLLLGSGVLSKDKEQKVVEDLLTQGSEGMELVMQRARYLQFDELATTLLAHWGKLGLRNQGLAANAMMGRGAWRDVLVSGLEKGSIQPSQLTPTVVQSLTSHSDRNLRSRAVAVFGQPSPRQSIVSSYLAQMPNPSSGDFERGKKLFVEHCAVCHAAQEGKQAVGPPIDNIAHWNNEQWITAVLDPSAAVEGKYKQTILRTYDQEVFAGIVVQESEQELRLALNDGTVREIAIEDIEDRKPSAVSLMPDGFETRLSPKDLADLIGYFRSGK